MAWPGPPGHGLAGLVPRPLQVDNQVQDVRWAGALLLEDQGPEHGGKGSIILKRLSVGWSGRQEAGAYTMEAESRALGQHHLLTQVAMAGRPWEAAGEVSVRGEGGGGHVSRAT